MNPQFFQMVDVLADRGIRCEFYTNGSLLTPAVWPEILSRTNIDVISISCDGAKASTFESLRVGGDFEGWRRSVGGFLAEAKAKRPHTLSVGANVVVSRPNLAEIGDIVRLAAELGFDNVSMLDPIPVDDVAAALCPSAAEVDVVRDEASELAKSLGLGISSYFRRHRLDSEGASRLHAAVGIRLYPRQRRRGPMPRRLRLRQGGRHGQRLSAGVLGHLARRSVSAVPPRERVGQGRVMPRLSVSLSGM